MVNSNEPNSQCQSSAFVPGFNFDIFVSYAIPGQQEEKVADLEEEVKSFDGIISNYERQLLEESSESGKKQNLQKEIIQFNKQKEVVRQKIYILQKTNDWLDNLVDRLREELLRKSDLKMQEKINIWLKPIGNRTTSLPDDTQRAVRSSAILLVILSDHYLKSQSCQKERELFLEIAKQKDNDIRRHIVVVQQTETERDFWPQEFDDLRIFSLFKKDYEAAPARTLGMPKFDPNNKLYFDRLGDLSRYLAECLRYQKLKTLPPESKGTIFLAEVSADLEELRDNFRRDMEIDGWQVLPETCYRRSLDALEKSLTEDLNKSDLFVQLLGQYTTKKTKELPKGYETFQLDLAKKVCKPILRWLDPNLDVVFIEDRMLLEQEPLYNRMPYEKFKEEVKKQAKVFATFPRKPSTENEAYTFVDYNDNDSDLANRLCTELEGHDISWFKSHPNKKNYPADKKSLDIFITTQQFDGVMVVYGKCGEDWIDDRLLQYRPMLLDKKDLKPACALYIGPPPDPPSPSNKLTPKPPSFYRIYTSKDPTYEQFLKDVKESTKSVKISGYDYHLGYSNQQVAIKPTEMRDGKPVIRYFISYARKDRKLKDELLERLKEWLATAKEYYFDPWEDGEILAGEDWHKQIQAAVDRCQFGLLLVSPAFLSSSYITDHELPAFVASNLAASKPGKRAIPVALKTILLDGMDLKGLEQLQIFRYRTERAFDACSNLKMREDFTSELFQQILKIVKPD